MGLFVLMQDPPTRENLLKNIRANLDLFESQSPKNDYSYLLDCFAQGSLDKLIDQEKEKSGGERYVDPIQYDILRKAYSYTVSREGEIHGVTSGDMGYEATGIILDSDTKAIWDLGIKENERINDEKEAREANKFKEEK